MHLAQHLIIDHVMWWWTDLTNESTSKKKDVLFGRRQWILL